MKRIEDAPELRAAFNKANFDKSHATCLTSVQYPVEDVHCVQAFRLPQGQLV